jgi:RHS repeat-associated protein
MISRFFMRGLNLRVLILLLAVTCMGLVATAEACRFLGVATSNEGPQEGSDASGGDPVDLGTGALITEKTDQLVQDTIPLSVTRTYQPDRAPQHCGIGVCGDRPFGLGATHNYELYLEGSPNAYVWADLILPDGGRIRYDRISSGLDHASAVMEHATTPTRFLRSVMRWNAALNGGAGGWEIKTQDGTTYEFKGYFGPEFVLLSAIKDRNGNTTTIQRDSARRITRVTSPHGRWIDFSYSGAGTRVQQITDNSNRTVFYTYDGSGRLWRVTDANGGVTEYTYDTNHRMTTIRDARGIVFLVNAYDANGRISRQTQADGTTYQFTYLLNALGVVTRADVTNARGFVRRVTFNSDRYPLTDQQAVGSPLAQTATYERQPGSNLILAMTDALGRRTEYGYDARGNLTGQTQLAGTAQAVTTTYAYDPVSHRVTRVTDPLNHSTTFTYDAKGNLTRIADALGHATVITYNAAGQPLAVTDPLGNMTSFTYDTNGNLVTIRDALGHSTQRAYDAVNRLSALTDARSVVTQFTHDPLNRVTRITDALSGLSNFAYDPNGNLLSVADAKAQATTYTYSNMDRLATRQDALLHNETYAYDANGNVATITTRKGQVTTYTYDALDRRTRAVYHDNTSTEYTYDAGNRVTQVQDKNAGGTVTATITRTYDGLDRLTQETTPQGTVTYGYDAASRRTAMTVAGQPAVTYTYDAVNRLTGVTQGSSTVTIAYDAAGRRTSVTLPTGTTILYGYDAASRLTGLTYRHGATTLGALTYDYDAAGNRIKQGGSLARTAYPPALVSTTYNASNQQTTFGANAETYDLNGNLATITDTVGTATYTWNVRNQLAGITATGFSASFAYDAFGRRTGKTIQGVTTNYLYDGLNPVQEKNGITVTANLLTGLEIDEFFTRTDGTGTRALLPDALGSTTALGDSAGNLQTQYTYEPFGYVSQTGQANGNSYKFTGREDDGTGLYYYRARYYQPRLQRFVSEDPIEFSGGDLNLHAYVFNSPTNYTDPTGEILPQLVACAIGAGLSAGSDVISGRKVNMTDAALGCVEGALGLRLAADAPWLINGRYVRVGYGQWPGYSERIPRIAIGPSPLNKGTWWGHWRLWPLNFFF